MPTRRRYERNTKKHPWAMTNPKGSERNTKKNPWAMTNPKRSERNTKKNPLAMVNPNYKFGKTFLVVMISKWLLLILEISTHSTCNVLSQLMILQLRSHFGPGPMHGPREETNRKTDSSRYLCNSVICTISSTWMLWI
jgi:hypothetical protein